MKNNNDFCIDLSFDSPIKFEDIRYNENEDEKVIDLIYNLNMLQLKDLIMQSIKKITNRKTEIEFYQTLNSEKSLTNFSVKFKDTSEIAYISLVRFADYTLKDALTIELNHYFELKKKIEND